MNWKDYLIKLWYKLLYVIIVIIYLIKLNKVNKILLALNFDSPFELLIYNNGIAIKYFGGALVFLMIGAAIIYLEVRKIKEGMESFEDIMIAAGTIIVVVILFFLIFTFIDNPILRAILASVFVIGVLVAATIE